MEHPGFSSRRDGLQLVRGDREGGSIPCCPTWALEMHLLCRARSISGGEHRWVVSCDTGSAHAALTYFVPGRNRGGWQLVPVLEASGRASLCASARAAWVPKPCPRPELGQSVAPLWRNAGFPLPSWDSLKVVLMRVVLEAPDRAAREGMVVLGALWPRCSCCCLGLGAAEGESLPEPRNLQLLQLGRPFLRQSSPFVSLRSWWCPSSPFHGISRVPAGDALSGSC